jgi:4-amino-4-deoxy-L-arabinose transferase-like glycosyltransferase
MAEAPRRRAGRPASPRTVAVLLCAVAMAAAVAFAETWPLPEAQNDAVSYLALARNIAAGNGFTENGTTPAVYRPPLFSLLLGGWYYLTGTQSRFSAAVFQSLEHAAAVVAAFLLFLEVAPLGWAAAAGLFLALNPLLVTRVAFVLQEPTVLLFTTLAVWLSVRLVCHPSTGRAGLTGAAWGLCTLSKVVAWFAPIVLLAMAFLPGRLRRPWRRAEAAALLLCFFAVVSPWTIRNYVRFDRLIPVNGQGEGMLKWNVSHAEIVGERPGSEYTERVYRSAGSEKERKALLWKYVLDHPAHFFFWRVIRNAIHFAAPARGWWDSRGYFAPGQHGAVFWILSILFHVPLYVLLLLRSWQWWNGRSTPARGFLLLFYLVYWAQHAVLWGDPRFGLAVYPSLVAIALPPTAGREEAAVNGVRTPAPA